MSTQKLYEQYMEKMRQIADVRNACAVLQWDQETYLPPKGALLRGQQIGTLSEISHQLFSSDDLGNLLQKLLETDGLADTEKRNVLRTWDDYQKNKKYTSVFVRQLSEQVNKCFHSWMEARKKNRFAVYEDDLDLLIQLKKEEAELLGYEQHPYNALLDEFEKGCTIKLLDHTFENLLPSLNELYQKIALQPQVDDSFLYQHFPKDQQWKWGMDLIKQLNFDFSAGRQDVSEHPFSISFNAADVRITTRINENDFGSMTWSCLHEAGHALYEQGLPENQYGLPLGEACSYSIHESQSRLWENSVGRSKEFCNHYFPQIQAYFPEQFATISANEFYKGINRVQPSLVRTEADEITYHLHVYIRYQLEKKLLEGSLNTKDIPEYWNEQYQKLLLIQVPDDKHGCLQDVHWSHGSFGYFPTYSLGSFYAAQFYAKAERDITGLKSEILNGNMLPLLTWLRKNIHSKGRYFKSEELCKEVTGEDLNVSFFMRYLQEKYTAIYNLS